MAILSQLGMDLPIHVRNSAKQIDKTSWLVGSKHVLRHIQEPDCVWENSSDGPYYTLSRAPVPPPDVDPDGHSRSRRRVGRVQLR